MVDNTDDFSLSLWNNGFAPVTYWYAELEVQRSKNNEKLTRDVFSILYLDQFNREKY